MNNYIDIYCERNNIEYWAEPINALTNIAFIFSGLILTLTIFRQNINARKDITSWILVSLILLIGLGSWLFHTHASTWAMIADVTPISIFILTYAWFALRRFIDASLWFCILGTSSILAFSILFQLLIKLPAGAYLGALLAMVIMGGYLFIFKKHPASYFLLLAAIIFSISLTLRTIDEIVCESFPLGTHFMWHLLNALVLFIVTRALIMFGKHKPS